MRIRDAGEEDADVLAALADVPTSVIRNLVHDRTVRVAELTDAEGTEPGGSIVGYVSFDAERDTVYVTQLDGNPGVYERLLEEPVRFARREEMAVELLATESDHELRKAAESIGFDVVGSGPNFKSTSTDRYRIDS